MEKNNLEKQPTTKENIEHSEISELYEPMVELLSSLRNSIEKGEYNLLIGDDASGRIPTLIFNKVLEEIYKEKGFKKPNVFFLPGQKETKDPEISNKIGDYLKNFLNYRKLDPHETKVLIITDTIASGTSLVPLTESLRNEKINYNIATISMFDPVEQTRTEKKLGSTIFSGSIMRNPSIYREPLLSGVEKNYGELKSKKHKVVVKKDFSVSEDQLKLIKEDLLARGLNESQATNLLIENKEKITKMYAKQVESDYDKIIQKWTNETRKDVDILSNKLVRWYKNQKEN